MKRIYKVAMAGWFVGLFYNLKLIVLLNTIRKSDNVKQALALLYQAEIRLYELFVDDSLYYLWSTV